ncbi:fluoride efflux transporter CrcB [Rhizobium sp. RAF56]|jgi:CrcB protein|uniref:fluoride efflux transporter CrcB n=1 Tax=Rhizobium sp. RAF56 TaxID=3233062 RepID=UPI003F96E5D9
MTQALLVAVGGAFGSLLRYGVGLWSLRVAGPGFPWGTLTVNLVGCFLIGVLAELISRKFGGSVELRLLLITGVLGGFTTFSAFSLDALVLFERGETVAALLYIASSVVVSLAAVFGGATLVRTFA